MTNSRSAHSPPRSRHERSTSRRPTKCSMTHCRGTCPARPSTPNSRGIRTRARRQMRLCMVIELAYYSASYYKTDYGKPLLSSRELCECTHQIERDEDAAFMFLTSRELVGDRDIVDSAYSLPDARRAGERGDGWVASKIKRSCGGSAEGSD
ncbi:uncharacterized protein BCR38DRAFT_427295 [Pseudomassariella vexata]|uniref:Uncharacterized protein n=1 Tax=Pseudomassariella vexata TaxID=1141098 RepID=A0A1Y2E7H4_9PEZI|nr:uncharacterized protein BCR38DRAFT_427295 [Pseudomassariella vexata]ORY67511.1 hypothetical protein BCR38DRAFT_427295 [Pseudomassariella vexata]